MKYITTIDAETCIVDEFLVWDADTICRMAMRAILEHKPSEYQIIRRSILVSLPELWQWRSGQCVPRNTLIRVLDELRWGTAYEMED